MTKAISDKRWPTLTLNFFQYFYIAIAILALVVLIIRSFEQFYVVLLVPAIIATVIAYGIYNRKSWVVLVITFLAAWGVIANVFSPESIPVTIFSIAFLGFEIYFFNRKDIREHFGLKGTHLF